MKQWYFPIEEFKAEPGFKFSFMGGEEGGPQYLHLCEVTEVEPQKRLTYSWRYEGMSGISYVTWELEKLETQTLLKITHTGVETFAEGGKAFDPANFLQGWAYFATTALPDYIKQKVS